VIARRLLPALLFASTAALAAEPVPAGKAVFDRNCSHCHAPGPYRPGTLQLGLTRGPDRAVLEERTDLTADYVRHVVRHGLKAMPPFVPSTITEAELRALTDYLVR